MAHLEKSTAGQNLRTSPVPDLFHAYPFDQLEVCLPKRGEEQATNDVMLDEKKKVFPSSTIDVCLHNYYKCEQKNFPKFSATEVSSFTSNHTHDRFVHG